MAKKSAKTKNGWAIAIVVFMILMMILFAAGGVLSSVSNQSSGTQSMGQNAGRQGK